MKRIVFVLLIAMLALSGCNVMERVIVSSEGKAPTPVEEVIVAETPIVPTDTAAPSETPTEEIIPTETAAPASSLLAYLTLDGNIHLKNLVTGEDRALTEDSTKLNPEADFGVTYYNPQWSSDGKMLAYQRMLSEKHPEGYNYEFNLWVYNLEIDYADEVLHATMTSGYTWRPGTHQLTYSLGIDNNYFFGRDGVDPALASGIWSIDLDAFTAPAELVAPSAGLTLVNPKWSTDGRILSFEEVLAMEGSGTFAYFDTSVNEYVRREQQVGGYDLAPDGSWLVFDTMTYIASGMERIWRVNLDWTGAQRISPHYGEGYAFFPRLSPDGQQVAYFKALNLPGDPDMGQNEIFVQPVVETNEPKSLGMVNTPVTLEWTGDGKSLIVSVSNGEDFEILRINAADGSVEKLADGIQPAMQP